MFNPDVPEFQIDLSLPEEQRWCHVIDRMKAPTQALLAEAGNELTNVPSFVRGFFAWLYRRSGGLYAGEMRSLGEQLGASQGTITVLNCAYELSHLQLPRVLGCTAGIRHQEGQGMVHVRTLDWPLTTMGAATCLFRFKQGAREFVSVGVPGQVGVLSGMVPGGYSVTINWAPPGRNPNFSFGPMFLLRNVLETCNRYERAVEILKRTPLSSSVFFTVCGVNPGQACVIERGQRKAVVRPLDENGLVVQANHHIAGCFADNNKKMNQLENAEFLRDSAVRAAQLYSRLVQRSDTDFGGMLDVEPVMNNETVQKMVFCPATGYVKAWRRD